MNQRNNIGNRIGQWNEYRKIVYKGRGMYQEYKGMEYVVRGRRCISETKIIGKICISESS